MKNLFKKLPSAAVTALLVISANLPAICAPTTDDGWMEDDQLSVRHPATMPDANETGKKKIATKSDSGLILKGGVTYTVPAGTPIKLKLSTVPDFGMKSLMRDLDGKLVPAQADQPITAKTTEDLFVDDEKVIPQGTVFQGKVTKIFPPRRAGRPGSLQLTFTEFQTPDGRRFAFRVEADNTRASTTKSKMRGTGRVLAHAAGGAIVGALVTYQLMGLKQTIAMHGYNIAAGAAAGALMGTAVALLSHGPRAVLEPGDDLNMSIDTDLLMPAATTPTFKPPPVTLPGLTITVIKSKIVDDGLDSKQLKVKAQIDNDTNRRLQSIDLFVEDDNGNRSPIVADDDERTSDMLFTVNPHSSKFIVCDFATEFPKLKRRLIWLDHETRQVIFEQKLP